MTQSKGGGESAQSTAQLWELADAVEMAQAHPYTFYRPSEQAIALLRPGHCVKLIFRIPSPMPGAPSAERMLVILQRIDRDRCYGELHNDPVWIRSLSCGAPIEFTTRHIIAVDFDDPVPDPTLPYRKRCIASERVLSGAAPVGFAARAEPMYDQDSGWRIWAAEETAEHVLDETNSQFVSLGAVLGQDDSFVKILAESSPCLFQRTTDGGQYERVDLSKMPIASQTEFSRPSTPPISTGEKTERLLSGLRAPRLTTRDVRQ